MTGQQSPENRIHPPALFRRPLHILHHHNDTFSETFIGQRTDIKRDFHLPENEVFQFLGGEFDPPAIDYVIQTPFPHEMPLIYELHHVPGAKLRVPNMGSMYAKTSGFVPAETHSFQSLETSGSSLSVQSHESRMGCRFRHSVSSRSLTIDFLE